MSHLARIEELVLKQLLGETSMEEDQEIDAWANQSAENRYFLETQMSPAAFHKKLHDLRSFNYNRLDSLMEQKLKDQPGLTDWITENQKRRPILKWSIAASIVLASGAAWWYSHRGLPDRMAAASYVKATLQWQPQQRLTISEMPAPESISLGDMQENKPFRVGGLQITRMGNQFFIYPGYNSDAATVATTSYTFLVDGSKDIQLFRYDSVRAQIYANSSVSFDVPPAGTALPARTVACTGQVLFDVTHNPNSPLIVRTARQEISVLGTLFRVRDYTREDTGAVFCYRGKVQVKDDNKSADTLEASQRATVRKSRELEVSTGDFPDAQWSSPEQVFDFSNMNLDGAMKEIARWYGISKVWIRPGIDRTTPGTVLVGKVSRYLPLPKLLSILDRADLHFTIQDQTILVTK